MGDDANERLVRLERARVLRTIAPTLGALRTCILGGDVADAIRLLEEIDRVLRSF